MEYSIQQIALDLARKITERTLLGGIFDLDSMSSLALSDCKEAARQIIELLIDNANLAIREDKASRHQNGLLMKEHDRKRDVLTELGRIEYERDYYYDRRNRRYTSPIDLILGVESYDRISKEVSSKLVQAATDYSYQRSAKIVVEGAVSRQSVRNKILKAPDLEVIPKGEKRSVKELHVYADEDHVHMQKPGKAKGKKSKQIPLVTVTEGVIGECQTRNKTINPMHFVDSHFNPKTLWENVDAYIRMQYELEDIKKVYVHGDGAPWIESGLNEMKQTEHVMDGYHLGKYLRMINNKFPNKNVRQRLEKSLRENDKEKANTVLKSLKPIAEETKQIEALSTAETYINNKWDELVNRRILDIPGSCTEGQVSHVLSERFSRNPMGWSKESLSKLSKLRVYVKNGGRIEGRHFRKNDVQDTSCYEKMIEREVSGCFDWSVFDGEPTIFDRSSGTQQLMHILGESNNWIMN